MEVILLEKIHNLGELGDKVRVKAGYGRNYLAPSGKATPATPDKIAEFEARREELIKTQKGSLAAATLRAESFKDIKVTISRKAGSEGKLYGSVGAANIVEAVTEIGVDLSKSEVRLIGGPLRMTGEYKVDLHLHADVDAQVEVNVVPEEG